MATTFAENDPWCKKTNFTTPKEVQITKFVKRTQGAFGEEVIFEIMEPDGVWGNLSLWTASKEIKFLTSHFKTPPEQWIGKKFLLRALPVVTSAGKQSYAWNVGLNV